MIRRNKKYTTQGRRMVGPEVDRVYRRDRGVPCELWTKMTTPSQYISAAASLCTFWCRRWDSNINDGEYFPQTIQQHSDVFYHLVTNLDCKHLQHHWESSNIILLVHGTKGKTLSDVGMLSVEVVSLSSDRDILRKGITCFHLSFPAANFSSSLSLGILSHLASDIHSCYCRNTPMSTKGNTFLCTCIESQSIIRKICGDTTTVSFIRCLLGIFLLPQMLLGFYATTT